MQELKLGRIGVVNRQTAAQIGAMTRADGILSGNYQVSGDSLRIDTYLIQTEGQKTLMAESVEGKLSSIFELQNDLARRIIEAISSPEKKAKKPEGAPWLKAGTLSLLLPGSAQLAITNSPIRGAVFLGLDLGALAGFIYYHHDYDKKRNIYNSTTADFDSAFKKEQQSYRIRNIFGYAMIGISAVSSIDAVIGAFQLKKQMKREMEKSEVAQKIQVVFAPGEEETTLGIKLNF
jgi:hypothetical protein